MPANAITPQTTKSSTVKALSDIPGVNTIKKSVADLGKDVPILPSNYVIDSILSISTKDLAAEKKKDVLVAIKTRQEQFSTSELNELTSVTIIELRKKVASQPVPLRNANYAVMTVPDYTYRYVLFDFQYNNQSGNLISNGVPVVNAINIIYNLIVGTKTKAFWQLSTVLGVNASWFLPLGYPGDSLTQNIQTLRTFKDCQIQQPGTSIWWTCAEAEKKIITVYSDLYTVNLNFQPVHYSGSNSQTFYSSSYYDDYRLYQNARQYYYDWSGVSMWRNYIE